MKLRYEPPSHKSFMTRALILNSSESEYIYLPHYHMYKIKQETLRSSLLTH